MSQLISCFKSFINILGDEEVFLRTLTAHRFLLLYMFCSMLCILGVYRQQPLQSLYDSLCLIKLHYCMCRNTHTWTHTFFFFFFRFDPLTTELSGERHLYMCVCKCVCVQDQFKRSCSSTKSHDCLGLYPYTWIAY